MNRALALIVVAAFGASPALSQTFRTGGSGSGGLAEPVTLTQPITLSAGACPSPSLVVGTGTGIYRLPIGAAAAPAIAFCVGGITAGFIGIASTPATNSYGNLVLGYDSGTDLDLTGGGTGDDGINNTFLGTETGSNVTSGMQNTYVGSRVGTDNILGIENTCVGQGACHYGTSSRNVGMGYHSVLYFVANGPNLGIGTQALEGQLGVSTGVHNTCVGDNACQTTTTAVGNTAMGQDALTDVTTGGKNVVIGFRAGYKKTSGVDSVIIGRDAGAELTSENGNVIVGADAGHALFDEGNTLLGWAAGQVMTSATKNTMVGHLAGDSITTGDNNTFIGADIDASSGRANCISIGSQATCAADNLVQLGPTTSTEVRTSGRYTGLAATLTAGTLASTVNALTVTGTLPTTAAMQRGVVFSITGANNGANAARALDVDLLAGYTGSNASVAYRGVNASVGTGTLPFTTFQGNFGTNTYATGNTASGSNMGGFFSAQGSDIVNYGVGGVASVDDGGMNMGGAFLGVNGAGLRVGAYIGSATSVQDPVITANAALIVNNNDAGDDIINAMDNDASVFKIIDGGSAQSTQVTSGTPLTWRVPTAAATGSITLPTCAAAADAGKVFYVDDTDDAFAGELCVCHLSAAAAYENVKVADNTTACLDP